MPELPEPYGQGRGRRPPNRAAAPECGNSSAIIRAPAGTSQSTVQLPPGGLPGPVPPQGTGGLPRHPSHAGTSPGAPGSPADPRGRAVGSVGAQEHAQTDQDQIAGALCASWRSDPGGWNAKRQCAGSPGGRIHRPSRRSRDRGGRRRAALNRLGNVSRTALGVTPGLHNKIPA